jgi:hypothetical protein
MPSDPMAAFLVFCRTTEIAPHHFEARVFVVPASGEEGESEPGMAARSECRIFESAELATSECARMAEAMMNRLAGWGHQVVRAEAGVPITAAMTSPTSSGPAGTP